jgi:hypothetical protein
MRFQPNAEEDSTASVIPPPAAPDVEHVDVLPGYRLHVRFTDGLEGSVEMAALIHSPQAGVFAALVDPARFAQAYESMGVVTWPGELDLAPDAMYDEIKKHGCWKIAP